MKVFSFCDHFPFSFGFQTNVWQAVLDCRPRPTLVELPLPDDAPGDRGSVLQVIPGHVMVDRCSGSCSSGGPSGSHACLPTAAENATVEVMAVQTTYAAGAWATVCRTATVERHTACRCGCRVREGHCDPEVHRYDPAGCQCRCKDQVRQFILTFYVFSAYLGFCLRRIAG